MPRVEQNIETDKPDLRYVLVYDNGGTSESTKIPEDALNVRLMVEWEEPLIDNHWTPEDVARHYYKQLSANSDFLDVTIEIANKIAELERTDCANDINEEAERYLNLNDFVGGNIARLMRERILCRTNKNTKYMKIK